MSEDTPAIRVQIPYMTGIGFDPDHAMALVNLEGVVLMFVVGDEERFINAFNNLTGPVARSIKVWPMQANLYSPSRSKDVADRCRRVAAGEWIEGAQLPLSLATVMGVPSNG